MAKKKASTGRAYSTRTIIRFIDGKPVVVERASFRVSKRQVAAFLSCVLNDNVIVDKPTKRSPDDRKE